MTDQSKAWRTQSLWAFPVTDGEQDDADKEDSDPAERVIPASRTSTGSPSKSEGCCDGIRNHQHNDPPEGCELWSGMAVKDGSRLRWFIELDGSGLSIMEEDIGCRYIAKDGDWRYCFMNVDPPDGAKEAILKAIRGALS